MSAAAAAAAAPTNYDTVCCTLCGGDHDEVNLVLCDCCDNGFHTKCIGLAAVPAGDWFCPRCILNGPTNNYGEGDTTPTGSKSVWFYTRVSSAGQDAPQYGRVGMNSQNSTLLAFAVQHGCVVNGTVREVCSARNPDDLAELQKLIKRVKRGDVILVTAVDRFSRNLAKGMDLARQIHSKGAVVFAIAEDIYSNSVGFLAALQRAQAFSDALSAKMTDTIASIRARGGFVGSVAPYGYSIERDATGLRKLVPNAAEQAVIKHAKTQDPKHLNSRLRFKRLRDLLNANPAFLRRGKNWTWQQVASDIFNQ